MHFSPSFNFFLVFLFSGFAADTFEFGWGVGRPLAHSHLAFLHFLQTVLVLVGFHIPFFLLISRDCLNTIFPVYFFLLLEFLVFLFPFS